MTRDERPPVICFIIACSAVAFFIGGLVGSEFGHWEIHQRIINNPQGYVDVIVAADNRVKMEAEAAQNLKELESAGR